jgi:hypothetical protein
MMEKYLFTELDAALLCAFLEPMLMVDMKIREKAGGMVGHKWLDLRGEDEVGEW